MVYWQVLYKSGFKGLRAHEPIVENDEAQKAYTFFWKNYLEKHLNLKGNEVYKSSVYSTGQTPEREYFVQPLHDFFVKELDLAYSTFSIFLEYMSDPPIRKWIEKRLAKDPDWFMPHYFWENPGYFFNYSLAFNLPAITLNKLRILLEKYVEFEFAQVPGVGTLVVNTKRADQQILDKIGSIIQENNGVYVAISNLGFRVEFIEQVMPPVWYEYSIPEITNEYFQLEFILSCLADIGDSCLNSTLDDLLKLDYTSDCFYRNWRVLSEVFIENYREKISKCKEREIILLFKKAYLEYVLYGKPTLDLRSALTKYKDTKDLGIVLKEMGEGVYKI
jgi:hypothetical protein